MTIARGSSAPTPHLPIDWACSRSIDTYRPTVTFTRSGWLASNGAALAMIVAAPSCDHRESASPRDESIVQE